MPRLLVLTQTHNIWGGIEVWMSRVFPALTSQGWDVHFGLAQGAKFNNPKIFLQYHPYIRQWLSLDGRVGTSYSRQQAIKRALEVLKPEVVMPLGIGDCNPAVRMFRAQGGVVKLVHAVHSTHSGTLADLLENWAIIDGIGSVSGLLYRWTFAKLQSSSIKLFWVKNGVNPPVVDHRQFKEGVLRLAYVGRMDPTTSKRVLDIIPILQRVVTAGVNIKFSLIGDGPALQKLIDNLNILQNIEIEILGFVERDFLYYYIYPNLDCLLLCSGFEASPLVLIEAMRHGVVPICSRYLGYASEGLLQHGNNCLTFPVGDYDEAVKCITRLSRESEFLKLLSCNAVITSSQYDMTLMAAEWNRQLMQIIDDNSRPIMKSGNVESSVNQRYGRLERYGMSLAMANKIRNVCRLWYDYSTGFDEWPGSLSTNGRLQNTIMKDLKTIEGDSNIFASSKAVSL